MQRLTCLDGLRGALALYVMLSHMAPFAVMPAWLASLLSHGGAGVDVFFILSGLVIVRSLESMDWQARPFLIARVSRIYPVYLAMFAFSLAVQPLPTAFEAMPWVAADSPARAIWSTGWPETWGIEIVAHLTMTHGLFPLGVLPDVWVSFLGAAWSLSTEWQFYLLVLLLGVNRRGSHPAALSRIVGLFVLLAAIALTWQGLGSPFWQFSRAFLPNKAQYFALGIASATLVRNGAWQAYGATLAATLLLCGWQGGWDKLLPPLVWTTCLVAQLCPNIPGFGVLHRLLTMRIMLWLGAISYCLYLANEPIQKPLGLAIAWFADGDSGTFTFLWVPLAILLPLLAADWLHRRIEAPALRWGRTTARQTLVRKDNPAWIATRPVRPWKEPTG